MWRPKRMSTLKTKEESKVTQGEIQGSLKNRLLLLSDWARLEARHTKSSASCSPLSIFINKVLFEHSHLFPHHLGVAFVLHWRGRVLARKAVCAPKPGIFIIWSFIAQLCRFSSNQVRQEQKAAFSPFCLLLCLNLSENWHNADSPWKKKKKKSNRLSQLCSWNVTGTWKSYPASPQGMVWKAPRVGFLSGPKSCFILWVWGAFLCQLRTGIAEGTVQASRLFHLWDYKNMRKSLDPLEKYMEASGRTPGLRCSLRDAKI